MVYQLWGRWRYGMAVGLHTAFRYCVISCPPSTPIATPVRYCAPMSILQSPSTCMSAPTRPYSNGRIKQPILYMFTKKHCSLCDEAKEKLAPYLDRLRLEEVDITRPENQLWHDKYQYDIPVFHLHEELVFQHRVDLSLLEVALQRYECQDDDNANASAYTDHTHVTASHTPIPQHRPQSAIKTASHTPTPQRGPQSAINTATTTDIYFDLETTGLERNSHITQMAAVRGDETFSCYVMPEIPISRGASDVTGLRVRSGKLYLHGKEVDTLPIKEAFTLFLDFLSKTDNNVLIGHNIQSFDCPVILNALTACDKVDMFMDNVAGFLDTLKLFRMTHPTLSSHAQVSLVRSLVDVEYEAHNAMEDVIALQTLVAVAVEPGKEELKQKAMFSMKTAVAAISKEKVKPSRYAARRFKPQMVKDKKV